jgi:hypothetical protein
MAVVSLVAGLGLVATPAPASATTICEPVPVSTPSVTVLGHREPALSNFELCYSVSTPVTVSPPEVITGCGDLCVGIRVTIYPVTAGIRGGTITLSYTADGAPESIVVPVPNLGPTWDGPTTICVISIGDAC